MHHQDRQSPCVALAFSFWWSYLGIKNHKVVFISDDDPAD